MSNLTSKAFWGDAVERAVRTVAQAALSLITINGTTLLNINWVGLLSVVGLAGLISILMSIVASGTGNDKSASFVNR